MKTLDPRMKEIMKRLIERPEMMSADDMEVQPESIEDAEAFEVEEPADEYVLPEEIKQMADDLTTDTDSMVKPLPDPIPLKIQSPISKIQSPISNPSRTRSP